MTKARTDKERKAMFAKINQSAHAKRIDRSVNARTRYSRSNSSGVEEWEKNPNRIDIRGVDTAKSSIPPRTRKKIDKKEDVSQESSLSKEERIKYYKEKQERKLERAEDLADKHKSRSDQLFKSERKQREMIPLGQPILVGHHSEGRHRRDLARMDNQYRKAIEEEDKAEHYQKKADRIESNTAISSDDPEAVDKLKTKLEKLEEKRTYFKEHNKKSRKEGKEPLPPYILSNLGQNIGSTKERIKTLESREKIQDSSKTVNNVEIKINKLDNRVELHFPDKPNPEFRNKLKRNGFRWSSYKGVWQRQLNNRSIYLADDLAEEYK